MPTFKLRFFTYFDQGGGCKKKDATLVTRYLVARDLADAKTIGEAMRGEMIWAYEYLDTLLSVETAKDGMENEEGYWDDGSVAWERVFRALKIEKPDVDFIRNSSGFIVGFRKHDVS